MPASREQVNQRIPGLALVALHLIPGIALAVFFVVVSKAFIHLGYTAYLALILAIPGCLVPVELGVMLWWSRKFCASRSLADVIKYRKRVTAVEYVVLPLLLFLCLGALSFGIAPVSRQLGGSVSSWVPQRATQDALVEGLRGCPSGQRTLTLVFAILCSGFAAPIVEELYFRGFLLPRMEHLKWAAPAWSALLFALYHFYMPWNVLVIFVGFLPICYVVWKTKDVRIGILTHVIINVWGVVQLFAALT